MSSWKSTADVVIIGGGIMGTCTAYFLAKHGWRDICLLERDLLAQGSTGLSVGGIRQQFSHPANIRLSQESVRVFERFEGDFGVDIKFCQAGYLFLARKPETWRDFLDALGIQRRLHVPVEVLVPEEIKKRWPFLRTDDIVGGTFGPKDGYADPYLVTMGFAGAARKMGVSIEELTEVRGINSAEGRILGVETTRGPIASPIVVNTAGAWAAQVAKMAGLDVPVKPYRRQVFMTSSFEGLPRPVPMIIDQDVTFYLRGADPGIILGMSDPEEPPGFNLNVDREFMEKVVEQAVYRVPILETARILRGWAGLYEVTPDDNPIIGKVPSVEGLFCAVGFSGHGFQQGPAVGRILSDLITEGWTDFDLSPFALNRFNRKIEKERKIV